MNSSFIPAIDARSAARDQLHTPDLSVIKERAFTQCYLARVLGAPELLGQVLVLAVAGTVDGHLLSPVRCCGNPRRSVCEGTNVDEKRLLRQNYYI